MIPENQIDFYKADHRRQYPDGTRYVYSNFTPRTSRIGDTDVIFFGLQYFLQRYLNDEWFHNFFQEDQDDVVERYERRITGALGPNQIGTEHIRALHDLGYFPLRFCALPEGTACPLQVPMLTVENTHPDFAWLVNYFETLLSSILWMPSTSATTARGLRRILEKGAKATGGSLEFVDWQAHDFSFRGMAGPEAAAISGAGHLLFFTGTDTVPAIDLIEEYYPTESFIGGSVAATEHSVMCAGGNDEGDEQATFERLLDLYPTGIVSVVSDTWDLWNVLTSILPNLADQILKRDGKLVIRPDSGDPVKIICGDPDAREGTPEHKGVIQLLWNTFGGTHVNGYRVLDPHIGAIYGDSITPERMTKIIRELSLKGFSSSNMVFGVGSYTYQYVTRDTQGFAMKATWVDINGEGKSIYKDPKTDSGMKKSAKGRLSVVKNEGKMILINEASPALEAASLLQPVWEDGSFVAGKYLSFDQVRSNARASL